MHQQHNSSLFSPFFLFSSFSIFSSFSLFPLFLLHFLLPIILLLTWISQLPFSRSDGATTESEFRSALSNTAQAPIARYFFFVKPKNLKRRKLSESVPYFRVFLPLWEVVKKSFEEVLLSVDKSSKERYKRQIFFKLLQWNLLMSKFWCKPCWKFMVLFSPSAGASMQILIETIILQIRVYGRVRDKSGKNFLFLFCFLFLFFKITRKQEIEE